MSRAIPLNRKLVSKMLYALKETDAASANRFGVRRETINLWKHRKQGVGTKNIRLVGTYCLKYIKHQAPFQR